MGEGLIVRKRGIIFTPSPSINFVSKNDAEIVFTLTNNDGVTADLFWEVDDTTPEANTLSLAGGATSSNITISGLTDNTEYTIYAFSISPGKAGSSITKLTITTEPILYYVATGGNTLEYNSGGKRYRTHTFLENGTFEVTTAANGVRNPVDYLVIAGGGAGGAYGTGITLYGIGGGGAGGYRTTNGTSGANSTAESTVVLSAQSYPIVIGAGGAGNSSPGLSGNNSSALGIISIGGGGGGGITGNGVNGGSGGGAGAPQSSGNRSGGLGTANQGFNGGTSVASEGGARKEGGGGGGAGQPGVNAQQGAVPGPGGNGLDNLLRTGSNETRGGGGGGASRSYSNMKYASGGTGGGGGTAGFSGVDVPGVANTGGGGGAIVSDTIISNGGSGIVVIRYEIAPV